MLYKDRKKNWHKKHMFNDLTNLDIAFNWTCNTSFGKQICNIAPLTNLRFVSQDFEVSNVRCYSGLTSLRFVSDYQQKKNYNSHSFSPQIKVDNNIFKYRDLTSLLTSPKVMLDVRSEKRSFVTTPYIITAATVLKNTKVASKGSLGRPPVPSPLDLKWKWFNTLTSDITKGNVKSDVTKRFNKSEILKSVPTSHIVTPPKEVLEGDRRNGVPKSPRKMSVPTSHNMTHTALTSPEVAWQHRSANTLKSALQSRSGVKDVKPKVALKRGVGSSFRSTTGSLFKNAKKRKIKGILGKIYISSTKNNTIITLIDKKGDTKGWSCSGSLGFKNARKSTTYAAQAAAENIVKKAKALGYTHLRLLVKGLGRGKQSCLRALSKCGLKIISIEDQTGIPYNGCRLSKKRRV